MPREALKTRSIFHLFQNIVYFSPCLENGISQHVHDEALLLTYLPTRVGLNEIVTSRALKFLEIIPGFKCKDFCCYFLV